MPSEVLNNNYNMLTANTPLVSIIVPIYNAQNYIEKCLSSLINQTYRTVEILCIDDGSGDNSQTLIQNFALVDKRIKCFYQTNSGPATARNLGLKNASGKYIMFCDSDDWYDLNMCEVMVSHMENENVDFAMCDTNFHFSDEDHNRSRGDIDAHILKIHGRFELTEHLRSQIFVVLWNKIFKKSIVDQNCITFPDGFEFDDNSFIYQYIAASQSGIGIGQRLYNYLVRKGSIMDTLDHTLKYPHMIESLAHTMKALSKNNLFRDGEFIDIVCESQMKWAGRNLNQNDRKLFYTAFKEKVVPLIPADISLSNDFLFYFSDYNFTTFLDRVCNSIALKRIKVFSATLYKSSKSLNKESYYVLGIQIFKFVIKKGKRKYYFLGLCLFKKKQETKLLPKRSERNFKTI